MTQLRLSRKFKGNASRGERATPHLFCRRPRAALVDGEAPEETRTPPLHLVLSYIRQNTDN